ncbi:MAG: dipeptidyl-peptidase 3 family protein, partial [Bacteroidota bacterium]
MYKKVIFPFILIFMLSAITACDQAPEGQNEGQEMSAIKEKLNMYAEFTLESDLSHLSDNQKQMLVHLFEAADIMNEVFWKQAFGDKDSLFNDITDKDIKAFAKINYGPWDRLNGNEPFVEGYGPKPAGANFYPQDMTAEEFENWDNPDKTSLYTLIRRDEEGNLKSIWYSEAYKEDFEKAAELLRKAAELSENPTFTEYLNLRAEALLTNDYRPSDMAWLDVKGNDVDLVYGPIENYEDQLFGYKAACEAFILIKDKEWSDRLTKYAALLPGLQKNLPVEQEYKNEMPGSDADLNAYDAIYYAGDCNAGSKTIAINLPNDEVVQLEKGTRKLQLKNAMKAKFEEILLPISKVVIAPEQRKHVT